LGIKTDFLRGGNAPPPLTRLILLCKYPALCRVKPPKTIVMLFGGKLTCLKNIRRMFSANFVFGVFYSSSSTPCDVRTYMAAWQARI
jgi:hypothetical protein